MQTADEKPALATAALPALEGLRAPRLRLGAVDLLRGLAALAVMCFHANTFFWRQQPNANWLHRICQLTFAQGFLGVSLFFVISGFCIHLPYVNLKSIEATPFLVRRFWRLYPPYLAVVVVFFAVIAAVKGVTHTLIIQFVGHLFFWHYTDRAGLGFGVTPVLWTISLEVEFYLLYLILRPVLVRIGWGRAAAIGIAIDIVYHAALGWYLPLGPMRVFSPGRFAPVRFGEWLLGAWVADAFFRGKLSVKRSWWIERTLIPLAFGLLALGIWPPGDMQSIKDQLDILAAVAFTLILARLISREMGHGNGEFSLPRPFCWLADRSYSLYLVHFAALDLIGRAYAKLAHIPDRDAVAGTLRWLPVPIIGMALSLVIADIMFRLVERPSHRLARSLAASSARKPVVAPLPAQA